MILQIPLFVKLIFSVGVVLIAYSLLILLFVYLVYKTNKSSGKYWHETDKPKRSGE